MTSQIAALHTALTDLLKSKAALTDFTVLTADQFMDYARAEVAKAEKEGDAGRPRLEHLLKNVAAATVIEKNNAFGTAGVPFPIYRGPNSLDATTNVGEMASTHASVGKAGKVLQWQSANTEAEPKSQMFGRGGPGLSGGQFTFKQRQGKQAAILWCAEIGVDEAMETAVMKALSGDSITEADLAKVAAAVEAKDPALLELELEGDAADVNKARGTGEGTITPTTGDECDWPRDLNDLEPLDESLTF